VATSLPLPTNTIGSPVTSFVVGIGFSGSDMYMVGSAGQYAAYWVNGGAGTLLPMPSGEAYSSASAIAVSTQYPRAEARLLRGVTAKLCIQ